MISLGVYFNDKLFNYINSYLNQESLLDADMKQSKWLGLGLISFLTVLLFSAVFPSKTIADIDDLSIANVEVSSQTAVVTFTLPIEFISFVDDNKNGEIESIEVENNQEQLEDFMRDRFRLSNQDDNLNALTVQPSSKLVIPPNSQITTATHTTIILNYSWQQPLETLNIKYNLFPTQLGRGVPGLPTAHCLATIRWQDEIKTQVFTFTNKQLAIPLNFQETNLAFPFLKETTGGLFAIFGALIWGSFHGLSPGHGKTMVSAYLVGTKASLKQAIVLGLTTTVTHTIGVFIFGLIAWFASQYILPEQLSPWLSLISGMMILLIGLSLIRQRMKGLRHHHHHPHDHHHDHHHHHEVSVASWRDIFALGISGGLVPCPAATVLLLSTIALGEIAYGLMLVFIFSLGLTVTLTGLGIIFIYGKKQFQKLPQGQIWLQKTPILGAISMTIIGVGITSNALLTIL